MAAMTSNFGFQPLPKILESQESSQMRKRKNKRERQKRTVLPSEEEDQGRLRSAPVDVKNAQGRLRKIFKNQRRGRGKRRNLENFRRDRFCCGLKDFYTDF